MYKFHSWLGPRWMCGVQAIAEVVKLTVSRPFTHLEYRTVSVLLVCTRVHS